MPSLQAKAHSLNRFTLRPHATLDELPGYNEQVEDGDTRWHGVRASKTINGEPSVVIAIHRCSSARVPLDGSMYPRNIFMHVGMGIFQIPLSHT